MRKLFSFMLMAVGLLISGNAGAGNVCKMDGTEYATLAAAVAAVPDNNAEEKEIILIADDVEPDGVIIPEGKTIKINLNGHSISLASSYVTNKNVIDNSGILTMVGQGTTFGTPINKAASYLAIRNSNNGILKIYNGTYIGGRDESVYDYLEYYLYESAIGNFDNAQTYIYGGVFCSYNAEFAIVPDKKREVEYKNPAIAARANANFAKPENIHIYGGVFSHIPKAIYITDKDWCTCEGFPEVMSKTDCLSAWLGQGIGSTEAGKKWSSYKLSQLTYTLSSESYELGDNKDKTFSEVTYQTSNGTFPFGKAYVVHPITVADFTDATNESVALRADATIEADQEVAYLEIGASKTLTVKDGATLTIGDYGLAFKDNTAKLIIEPGAIVKVGAAGVLADDYANIEMQMSDTKSSQLIFSPEINLNYQPKATIVYTPTSYQTATKAINGHFGIPFAEGVSGLTSNNDEVEVGFAGFEYAQEGSGAWKTLGYLNQTGSHPALDLSSNPFKAYTYYQLLCKAEDGHGTQLTFTGNLMGNTNYWFDAIGYSWNGYANSYTGQIDIAALIKGLDGEKIDKSVYVMQNSGTDSYTWEVVNMMQSTVPKIQPMQAFLIRNAQTEDANDNEISYENVVYKPFENQNLSAAPKRVAANDMSTMNVIVTDAEGISDHVFLAESEQFSADYDNGYDAAKFMNPTINIYAMDEEKMAIVATDNLRNTLLGFSCTKGGEYTIHFDNVSNPNYCLVDVMNNISTPIQNGMTYQFNAVDNMTDDNRFMIVENMNAPTSLVNVTNGKPVRNGVYSVIGQFLGDINVWNRLPKGVYVVNGEKIVK